MRRRIIRLIVRPCLVSRFNASLQLSHNLSQHRRCLQIQATPSSSAAPGTRYPVVADVGSSSVAYESPDARFEVLGSPSSLLSVALSASQTLYTRRGTLVAVDGLAENAISTLSSLSPFTRAPLGIPFLYQKITSTTPLSLLIATKAPHTSFSVVNLDGQLDWKVVQRNGLLAWSGHTLTLRPSINTRMSLAHLGNTTLTGRGLVALAAVGQTYQVKLKAGEQYVLHPSNVLAYTVSPNPPQPYRFKSSVLRLQIPTIGYLGNTTFMRNMRATDTFKAFASAFFKARTLTRRTLWGDRLFLRFYGPTTILMQSRGSRIRDALTQSDVNEIADAPAGAVSSAVTSEIRKPDQAEVGQSKLPQQTSMSYANVGNNRKVLFTSE